MFFRRGLITGTGGSLQEQKLIADAELFFFLTDLFIREFCQCLDRIGKNITLKAIENETLSLIIILINFISITHVGNIAQQYHVSN